MVMEDMFAVDAKVKDDWDPRNIPFWSNGFAVELAEGFSGIQDICHS